MGAEYLIQLKSADDLERVKRWYESLPEEGRISVVLDPDHNVKQITSWIWVEFPERCLLRKNVVELGYSFGGQGLNSEVALAIGAEIIKRVKVKCWGWDSIGWCTRADMQKYGVPRPFRTDIERRRAFAKENPIKAKALDLLAGPVENLEKTQKQLEEWAAKFFEDTWSHSETKET